MVMADRIVILNRGLIEQAGSPEEIYHRPANRLRGDVPRRRQRGRARCPADGGGARRRAARPAGPPPGLRCGARGRPRIAAFPGRVRRHRGSGCGRGGTWHRSQGIVRHASYPGGTWRHAIAVGSGEILVDSRSGTPGRRFSSACRRICSSFPCHGRTSTPADRFRGCLSMGRARRPITGLQETPMKPPLPRRRSTVGDRLDRRSGADHAQRRHRGRPEHGRLHQRLSRADLREEESRREGPRARHRARRRRLAEDLRKPRRAGEGRRESALDVDVAVVHQKRPPADGGGQAARATATRSATGKLVTRDTRRTRSAPTVDGYVMPMFTLRRRSPTTRTS